MFKNVASQKPIFFAFDTTTSTAKTGDAANITPYVSKDYGAVTVLGTTTMTEMDSTNAKGFYTGVMTQGESNADTLVFSAKSSTANIAVIGVPATIFTRPNRLSSLVIDANGLADANCVKLGPTGAGTAQTARDIGLSVLLASGQKVDVDTIKTNPVVNGGTVTFPTNATLASTTNITAGTIATVTTVTNQLTAAQIATGVWQDATAGDFTTASSIGKSLYTSGVVPGGTNGLFIAGTNAATSITTGLTAHIIGTVDTVTTVTNQLTAAQIATGVWQDTTAGDFTVALSIGKSVMNGVALGTGLTINAYTGNTVQTGDAYARIGLAGVGLTNLGDTRVANLDATVSSRGTSTLTQTQVTGGAYSVQSSSCVLGDARIANLDATVSSRGTSTLDAAGVRTAVGLASANLDTQLSTIAGYIDTEVGTLVTGVAAIKVQTDKMVFTVANQLDVNVLYVHSVQVQGVGSVASPWGP